jgi:hypothetical protein
MIDGCPQLELLRAAIPDSRISGSVLFDSPFQKAPKPACSISGDSSTMPETG